MITLIFFELVLLFAGALLVGVIGRMPKDTPPALRYLVVGMAAAVMIGVGIKMWPSSPPPKDPNPALACVGYELLTRGDGSFAGEVIGVDPSRTLLSGKVAPCVKVRQPDGVNYWLALSEAESRWQIVPPGTRPHQSTWAPPLHNQVPVSAPAQPSARGCIGSTPCLACKSCNTCAHCQAGGTCGARLTTTK